MHHACTVGRWYCEVLVARSVVGERDNELCEACNASYFDRSVNNALVTYVNVWT